MKTFFGLSLSQVFGYFLGVFIALELIDVLQNHLSLENWQYWGIYFVLYFAGLWILDKIENIAFLASLEQKYSTAIFLTWIIFVFDISRNRKKLKIYSMLEKGIDVETLSVYFDDKDKHIQYVALLLYADVMSINPVLQWFTEKYTSKNLPIDEYFLPIYQYCIEKQSYA